MIKIGLEVPTGITLKGQLRQKKDSAGNSHLSTAAQSGHGTGARDLLQGAWRRWTRLGLPAVIRPCFTLGGTGGGIAYNREEFFAIVEARPRRLARPTKC